MATTRLLLAALFALLLASACGGRFGNTTDAQDERAANRPHYGRGWEGGGTSAPFDRMFGGEQAEAADSESEEATPAGRLDYGAGSSQRPTASGEIVEGTGGESNGGRFIEDTPVAERPTQPAAATPATEDIPTTEESPTTTP
jgi:hypothetical protein